MKTDPRGARAADSFSPLLDRARSGDREAFDRLQERYAPRVRRLVAARMGPRLKARLEVADLVQETFLAAYQSLARFRGGSESSFWSWLAAVATNAVRGAGRRAAALKRDGGGDVSLWPERTAPDDLEREGEPVDPTVPTASRVARADERFDRLRDALRHLSAERREVIRLARLEALPLREVARRMNRSEKAVSVLLLRALLQLREVFGPTESFSLPDRSLAEEIDEEVRARTPASDAVAPAARELSSRWRSADRGARGRARGQRSPHRHDASP